MGQIFLGIISVVVICISFTFWRQFGDQYQFSYGMILPYYFTSTLIVVSVTIVTYVVLKLKYRLRNAIDVYKYMKIKVITTELQCDEIIKELIRCSKQHKALGFDCEWITDQGKRQPVALIQMSTNDGLCGLFRLNQLKDVPKSLKDLLEDANIYKIGVAPIDDAKYLCQDYGVIMKSTLDVRHIAELCGHDSGGLASLTKSVLRVVLDKSWRIRCSNWEAEELSSRQINYAAADAHAAIKIFVTLLNQYSKSRSYLSFSNDVANKDIWKNVDQLCWRYADVCFKTKQNATSKISSTNKSLKSNKETLSKRYPHATRSKPLYHNCFLEAPDGELLCTCDNKKALWYVEKQLADTVNEDPLTVRLRFEPSGRSVGDVGRYYQLTKENKCVVCGSTNSYIRKNVVPREYRKYFPEIMKDHSSHDVLLLCTGCHQRSNMFDQAVRERLAHICDAPLASHEHGKYKQDADSRKIRSAARALLLKSTKHMLPQERRSELENILLKQYPQYESVTDELLKEAAKVQYVFENAEYESHGIKVVEYFMKQDGGLLSLEELWREHFLNCMCPKYMPELWSVKHNEERLRVKLNEGRLSIEDLKATGGSRWI